MSAVMTPRAWRRRGLPIFFHCRKEKTKPAAANPTPKRISRESQLEVAEGVQRVKRVTEVEHRAEQAQHEDRADGEQRRVGELVEHVRGGHVVEAEALEQPRDRVRGLAGRGAARRCAARRRIIRGGGGGAASFGVTQVVEPRADHLDEPEDHEGAHAHLREDRERDEGKFVDVHC